MHHAPIFKTVLVALFSIGLAGAASAQAAGKAGKLSHHDRQFVENAVRSNMAEYELGKLAEQHAASPEVKQFAERMVSDHGKAGEELREVAQHEGTTLPDRPRHSEKREMGKLAKLGGAQFDRAYIDHMVKDHRKDVKEFQEEAQKAKDPQVKQVAEQMLPTLKEHLQMAEQAQAALGGARTRAQAKEGKSGHP
jgi:putative membrane protein